MIKLNDLTVLIAKCLHLIKQSLEYYLTDAEERLESITKSPCALWGQWAVSDISIVA